MEILPVSLVAVLVAVAGPLGVTLGWWLGRRSEKERGLREERKTAYTDFIRALFEFRSADMETRHQIRQNRWVAFATLVLVAPPAVLQASWRLLSVHERLLEDVDGPTLKSIQDDVWRRFRRFTALARSDLRMGAGDVDPFGGLEPATSQSGPPVLAPDALASDD